MSLLNDNEPLPFDMLLNTQKKILLGSIKKVNSSVRNGWYSENVTAVLKRNKNWQPYIISTQMAFYIDGVLIAKIKLRNHKHS